MNLRKNFEFDDGQTGIVSLDKCLDSIKCGTILLAVGTHQTCLATRLDPRLAALVSTSRSPHRNDLIPAGGLGTRLRTPDLGIATRRYTWRRSSGRIRRTELFIVVTLLGRTPRHNDHKSIIGAGLEILESQGFSEQTLATVLLCQVSASES